MWMETVLPPSSTTSDGIKPYGWKPCPSKAFYVVGDFSYFGEPMALQQDKEIIDV